MTKDELIAYIQKNGEKDAVIAAAKELASEGKQITEETLTMRLNMKYIEEAERATRAQTQQTPYVPPVYEKTINKHLYVWLLSGLFGFLGVDRFARGQVGLGILKLVTVGGFCVLWSIDWIIAVFKAYGKAFDNETNLVFIDRKYAYRNTSNEKIKIAPIIIILVVFFSLGVLGCIDEDETSETSSSVTLQEALENTGEEDTTSEEKSAEEIEAEKLSAAELKARLYFADKNWWKDVFQYEFKIHYITDFDCHRTEEDDSQYGSFVAITGADVQNGFGATSYEKIYLYMDEEANATKVIIPNGNLDGSNFAINIVQNE